MADSVVASNGVANPAYPAVRKSREASVVLAGGLVLLVPLLVTPFLPIIDLYSHVARYVILDRLPSDPFLSAFYQPNWALLPNIGGDLIGLALLQVFDALTTAKLIVASILLLQYGGVLFLHRHFHRHIGPTAVALAVGLSYSHVLVWGFTNFLFGVGLSFWGIGLWLRLRDRPALATMVCAPIAAAIMLCHGFAFGLYGLFIAAFEAGSWMQTPQRAPRRLLINLSWIAVQAVLPIIFFLAAPTAGARSESASLLEKIGRYSAAGELDSQVASGVMRRLFSIVRISESPYLWLDIAVFAAVVGVVVWNHQCGRIRFAPAAIPAIVLGVILVVVLPDQMFSAGHLVERPPLLLALVAIAALGPVAGHATNRSLLHLIPMLIAIKMALLTYGWSEYRRHYDDFRAVMAAARPHRVLSGLVVGGPGYRNMAHARCEGFGPLAAIFDDEIVLVFANPVQQPLRTTARLDRETAFIDAWGAASRSSIASFGPLLRSLPGKIPGDLLLICGADRLKSPLPPRLALLARRGLFDLYEVRPIR